MAFALGLGTMDQVSGWSPAAAWDRIGPGAARAGAADDATASATLTSSTVRARRCMGLPYAWPGDQDARRRVPVRRHRQAFLRGPVATILPAHSLAKAIVNEQWAAQGRRKAGPGIRLRGVR